MTKPKDTKSSLFAGGRLLPETSPEEYQKAAREDLDVTFDDARIADMRTQAVARAEAGLADWERRVPRIADRSGWWRVTFAGLEAPFTVGAAESRKTIIATARMVWEGTHKMKLREREELDIQPLDGRAPHLSAGYGTMTLTAKHSAPSPKYHHNWQDGALTGEQMRVPTSLELHHLAEANGSVFVPGRRPCRVMEVDHARGLHGMARLAFGDGRGTDWVPLIDLRVPRMPEVGSTWRDSGATPPRPERMGLKRGRVTR